MTGRRRGSGWLIALAIATSVASTARAEPINGQDLQDAIAIEVGVIGHVGQSEYAFHNGGTAPAVHGLRIRDRNGWTGRAVVSVVLMIIARVGMTGPRTLSYDDTYVTSDRSNCVTGVPCTYTQTTTTVTTTHHLAEKEEIARSAGGAIAGLFSVAHSDFELDLFSRAGYGVGDASGFKLNALVGGGKRTSIQVGFGLGTVVSYVEHEGAVARINYSYLGMPFRISRATGPVRWALTYEWNWLGYGGDSGFQELDEDGAPLAHNGSHPVHLDASGVMLGRLSVTAGVTAQRFYRPGKLGAFGSVGFRF